VDLPAEGVLLSRQTADKLGLKTGDRVEVETALGLGPVRKSTLLGGRVSTQLVGGASYMEIERPTACWGKAGWCRG
jgi:anaerobic selenocysteine-containing dehydrogenase